MNTMRMNEMKWSRRRRKKNTDNLYGMPFFGRFSC